MHWRCLDPLRYEINPNKTNSVISEKRLPFMIETLRKVASAVAAKMAQGAMTEIK
ncbi:hypothetical protein Psch_01313 [Pelotomaculum schinkii]|uniref:Uncharacterized protein n=1 Tax=Pelotomaculum schinkii TaxID=78350 RepID=A0A4Y7RFH7_9FIRM|nr:hypothetical protein Psch_01313 [Pelotomaculum schinkii]TEB16062.1 hypothetical protein Psfp_01660 [Pelotomaculum sp. FP]